jgi:hypothetical protein
MDCCECITREAFRAQKLEVRHSVAGEAATPGSNTARRPSGKAALIVPFRRMVAVASVTLGGVSKKLRQPRSSW